MEMRALFAAVLCASLVFVLGCATTVAPTPSIGREPPARSPNYSDVVGKPDRVVAGTARPERIVLPLETHVPALSYDLRPPLTRPPVVDGRLDVPLGRTWKYIVIHHSASKSGSEAIFDRDHRLRRHWQGVGYDFVIGNGHGSPDGKVEVTFRWENQITGAHAASEGNEYNEYGIGICLVGDFEESYPTARQMEALVGLVNYLQERCRIPTYNIMGHRDVPGASTECPGKRFPWYEFLSLLEH
jgi:N-acetylmuramoyl-L-alanine amidase